MELLFRSWQTQCMVRNAAWMFLLAFALVRRFLIVTLEVEPSKIPSIPLKQKHPHKMSLWLLTPPLPLRHRNIIKCVVTRQSESELVPVYYTKTKPPQLHIVKFTWKMVRLYKMVSFTDGESQGWVITNLYFTGLWCPRTNRFDLCHICCILRENVFILELGQQKEQLHCICPQTCYKKFILTIQTHALFSLAIVICLLVNIIHFHCCFSSGSPKMQGPNVLHNPFFSQQELRAIPKNNVCIWN